MTNFVRFRVADLCNVLHLGLCQNERERQREGAGETNLKYTDLQQDSERGRAEDAVLKDEPQFLR